MSSNDLILLNQFLDQRLSEVGQELTKDEYFELFCAEQVVKHDDLSYEELESGIIDGGGDGGIDSLYFFVNDVLFDEDTNIFSLKKNVSLRLVLIQSKISSGFAEAAIEKLISSARDLFDLNKDINDLTKIYKYDLINKISKFRDTYMSLVSKFPSLSFNYAYATKGTEVHPKVERKVTVLEQTIKRLFSPISFSFKFLTASELLGSARQSPASTSSLRLAENPISTGQGGFVCLVTLKDYLAFITDDNGRLRSHLFEGNVRDYQGETEVNIEIRKTLETLESEDFWWLNNGVSIICTNASVSTKTLAIEDAEIVNGLQSSREIYNTLHGKDISKETRNLLVRVLKPQSQESRDRIIKATNSQTPIPAASLRATDKIHRDIEDYLYIRGYFYDRRKNYYKNAGKPIKKIFGIPFVAQSVMACALFNPASARARPSSLIKSEEAYKRIFNQGYNLEIYFKCPIVVRTVEELLKLHGKDDDRKHLNNIRFYIAMLWVLTQAAVPHPSVQQISNIDISTLTLESLEPVASEVWTEYMRLGGNDQVAKGAELGKNLLEMHRKQSIQSIQQSPIN